MGATNSDYINGIGLEYALTKIKNNLQAQYISYDDTNSSIGTAINNVQKAIEALQSNKVEKDGTKVLSDENFTTAYKNTLDGLADELAKYALLTGATFTGPITLPAVSASVNDNTAATTAYVTSAIATALSGITGIKFDGPYTSLQDLKAQHPTGTNGTIYLVNNGGSAPNTKDEYFWNGSDYELFGTTAIEIVSIPTTSSDPSEYTITKALTNAGFTV